MSTRIKGQARIAFPKLFEAEAFPGTQTKRYGASFLILKGSDLEKAIEKAIETEAQCEVGQDVAEDAGRRAWQQQQMRLAGRRRVEVREQRRPHDPVVQPPGKGRPPDRARPWTRPR